MRARLVATDTTKIIVLLCSAVVQAAPITYVYSGSWSSWNSAPLGPTYVATVVMDNGGTTVAGQTFTQADFVSASLVSGSCSATATAPDTSTWYTNFTSDALGRLGDGWFNANVGGDCWHFDNDYPDENFSAATAGSAGYFTTHISEPGSAVPVPATLVLLGLGLVGLGFAGRRRRRPDPRIHTTDPAPAGSASFSPNTVPSNPSKAGRPSDPRGGTRTGLSARPWNSPRTSTSERRTPPSRSAR